MERKFHKTMRPGRFVVGILSGALLLASALGPGRAAAAGPTIYHAPVPFAMRGAAINVTMYAACDTACTARVYWRTAGSSDGISGTADPAGWSQAPMGRGSPIAAGGTLLFNFFATLPGGDTRGVDYVLKVTDGTAIAYAPGSPAAPSFGVANGARAGWYHVYVTNPSQIVHAPVAQSAFRRAIDLGADAACASACSATLFYRRTGHLLPSGLDAGDPPADPAAPADVQWQSMPMKLDMVQQTGSVGADRYHFTASIPSTFVDTRGVDYAIRVTDGPTRAWSPGTSYAGYYLPSDGLRIGWYHVHVVNPALAYHTQTQFSAPHGQAVAVQVTGICWTETCRAFVSYHSFGGTIRSFEAAKGVVSYLADSRAIAFSATIPASDVVAPTLSYWFTVTDGYTSVAVPGTPYNGYYASVDGIRTGEYVVRVG